jgi:hypothetical protein
MGLFKAEESHLGEGLIWIALMIGTAGAAFASVAFPEDAAQAHAYLPLQHFPGGRLLKEKDQLPHKGSAPVKNPCFQR